MKLGMHACLGHKPLHKLCSLFSGRIRTLVAIATYIFHKLIMGRVKIDNFFCLNILDLFGMYFYRNIY